MNLKVKVSDGPVEVLPEGADVAIYLDGGDVVIHWREGLDLFNEITTVLVGRGFSWGNAPKTQPNKIRVFGEWTPQNIFDVLYG